MVIHLPDKYPVVRRNGNELPIGAQRQTVDSQRGRHGDGELGFGVGIAHVPDHNSAVLTAGDQQSLILSRLRLQRLPLKAGDGAIVGRECAALSALVPDLRTVSTTKLLPARS